ncbi:PREDICTED: uncharacterized protein LOC104600334 [Nelumbo nucifera]|uniref:Uncharacterized protein LOC104600334 n=1 Tax=Nelumbo nucifera TaxID=4432 RepID=A0A1U8A535_NELNU|nr:PREDICTED: uncharacterized protein LOC104600334 [Nelumbo nucifera]
MVKLASARENRLYGPRLGRNRLEFINAGLYVFASLLLVGGFLSQFSRDAKSGLVILLIALALISLVNVHDLLAHLAGIDYQLGLMGFDRQLALVEFAVPIVQVLGSVLNFLPILFFLIQAEKGRYYYFRLEKYALNMLIVGSVLWLIGSINNSCQIYERADGHVQILQQSVYLPFLMGSLLFLVGAILNCHEQSGMIHHGLMLLGKSWVWLGIFGSLLFLIGGLVNLAKVFKMQQVGGVRLEKLRGGAQEQLNREREGEVPLILEEQTRRKQNEAKPIVFPTPYKDALLGRS